jgi:hypothetical protein
MGVNIALPSRRQAALVFNHGGVARTNQLYTDLAGAFLEANGYEVSARANEAYEFLIGIASGRVSESEVERWIARHF